MISTSDINKAKQEIKNCKEKPLVVLAQNDEFNRKMLEYGKFDILLSIEKGNRKDNQRQIDSGLNNVLADIAFKNKVSIGIDLEELNKLNKREKAIRLARIFQNIKICRKSKTKITLLNYQDKKDAFSFLISLGASTQQAKEALSF